MAMPSLGEKCTDQDFLFQIQSVDSKNPMFIEPGLGRPRGMEWGGRREEGSGWGTHVYLWRIHFDIRQN